MNFFSGISYNLRGLKLGLATPRLLALGLVRFMVVVGLTILAAGLALAYHDDILLTVWARPDSWYLVWLWYVTSWLLGLLLVGLATAVAYLLSQVMFAVIIMDMMSQITERRISGEVRTSTSMTPLAYFFFLLKQEIPRTVLPVLISLLVLVVGWLTPLSPVTTVVASLAAAVFLAWDNTDLVPARRHEAFGARFRFLTHHLTFHLGFGLWFLIPVLNILFLSFAPVGATLFYVERIDGMAPSRSPSPVA